MNFVYISPAFPKNYFQFCERLKALGVNVLGIGDVPSEKLEERVKNSLSDYYYVPSLENNDDLMKAMGYYIYRYGRIDYVASNIEYWLETEAKLRTDFHIDSGMNEDTVKLVKWKSKMKEVFHKNHLPTLPYDQVTTYEQAQRFVRYYHYPVIIKPDNGHGVLHVHKIHNDHELAAFFQESHDYQYIMEPFIDGECLSYDGIANDQRDVLFEAALSYSRPLMEVANDAADSVIMAELFVPDDLKRLGRRVVDAFPSENSCFHIEFFRLKKDMPHVGQAGDLVVSEVNMRLPAGYLADVIGRFYEVDLYTIYAQMIVYGITDQIAHHQSFGAVVGRRRDHRYDLSDRQLKNKYLHHLVMTENVSAIFQETLGDVSFAGKFDHKKQAQMFIDDCVRRRK